MTVDLVDNFILNVAFVVVEMRVEVGKGRLISPNVCCLLAFLGGV